MAMHRVARGGSRCLRAAGLAAGLWLGLAGGAQAETASATALLAERQALQPRLRASVFGEPLVLSSSERSDRIEGDVHADLSHPFAAVRASLGSAAGVCEVLLLHLNVRACQPAPGADGEGLSLLVGPKRAGALGSDYRIAYTMRTEANEPGYLRVSLGAARGPLSTHDYHMVFEAVPLADGRSFVHFGYAYGVGTLGRLAMGTYLATAGRSKIGFTVVGRDARQRPVYVTGERAAIERNVMRYHLAVRAHLDGVPGADGSPLLARQRAWFALTERHAAQLHEYSLDDYLREKRGDLARSATAR
jgi:hypothetical protein